MLYYGTKKANSQEGRRHSDQFQHKGIWTVMKYMLSSAIGTYILSLGNNQWQSQ